jgi:hypothetical protein
MIITAIVAIASAASSTTSSARSFHVTHWPKIPGGWCLVGNDVKPCFFTQSADKTKSIITLTPSTPQTVSSTTTSARPFNVTHWPQILGGWCLIANDVKPCFFTQAADKTKFPIITLTPRAFQTVASATRLNARVMPPPPAGPHIHPFETHAESAYETSPITFAPPPLHTVPSSSRLDAQSMPSPPNTVDIKTSDVPWISAHRVLSALPAASQTML